MTILSLVNWVAGVASLLAADGATATYARPSSFDQFRYESSEETALARSAAPASIADNAEILVLGKDGYQTAIKGKNGFVCFVERSWAKPFDDAEFWNYKVHAPMCMNAAAARSVLPFYLEKTRWVLAGTSMDEMLKRANEAKAANRIAKPETGSMSYMMSNRGYITDDGGHWHSHVMFYAPITPGAKWGANMPASPLFSADDELQSLTIFFVFVPKWSDGTLSFTEGH